MKIEIKRYIYNTDVRNIISDWLINDQWFCYTLEDEIRSDGKKVFGETAIPAGLYKIKKTWSPKYGKFMLLIYNRSDGNAKYWIESPPDKNGNIAKWSGIRVHGGNDEDDSLGCVLAAYNTDGKRIWGKASDDLEDKFEEGKEYDIKITNQPFTYEGKYHS